MAQNRTNQPEEVRSEFTETVVAIDRVSRTVKGGRRMRFRALVVVGDGNGRVGAAVAKGQEVQSAVQKATAAAKRSMIRVAITDKGSIAHEIQVSQGATTVLLKPASEGTSVIAGGPVRAVVTAAGIENVLSKCIGSNNKVNVVMATLTALQSLKAKAA